MEQLIVAPRAVDDRDDAVLLTAVVERDRSAIVELYRRHEPWLSTRLSYRCSDHLAVEEAVQDTFVAVWESAVRYSGNGEVSAWIWGIGYRRLLHTIRPRRSIVERLLAQRPAETRSAEEELMVSISHGDLGRALERLSPELRAVVQATVLDGLTCRETGQLLGVPVGTVKTRMMRARSELREALA